MKPRLLLSLSLSAAALVLGGLLVWMAGYSPVKSLPFDPVIGGAARYLTPSEVHSLSAEYLVKLSIYGDYQLELLSAGGLALSAAIVLLSELGHHGPKVLRRGVLVSLLAISAYLFLFYVVLIFQDFNFNWPWFQFLAPTTLETTDFGLLTFIVFVNAIVGFVFLIHLFGKGWIAAIRDSFALFAIPGVMFLEIGLGLSSLNWLALGHGSMALKVVGFASWKYDGAYVLSNLNVLLVASGLGALVYGSLVFGAVRRKSWKRHLV